MRHSRLGHALKQLTPQACIGSTARETRRSADEFDYLLRLGGAKLARLDFCASRPRTLFSYFVDVWHNRAGDAAIFIFGHSSSSRVNIQIDNHNNATSRSCRIGDDVRKVGTVRGREIASSSGSNDRPPVSAFAQTEVAIFAIVK
jgi:hypothetical protein